MKEYHRLWSEWAVMLKSQGLVDLVVWLIRAGKPASLIISQFVIMILPFFSSLKMVKTLDAITDIMEDKDQQEAFVRMLLSSKDGE